MLSLSIRWKNDFYNIANRFHRWELKIKRLAQTQLGTSYTLRAQYMEQDTGSTHDPHRAEVPRRKSCLYKNISYSIIVEVWLLWASVFIAGWLGGLKVTQGKHWRQMWTQSCVRGNVAIQYLCPVCPVWFHVNNCLSVLFNLTAVQSRDFHESIQ